MSVLTSKKAELFYKALEDIWAAEQLWRGSPNISVWHCTQAVEKMMKGFLRCLNENYDYGHELKLLLSITKPFINMLPETEKNIMYMDDYGAGLRYRNMSSDPTVDDARVAITRTKQIMHEFGNHPKTIDFMKEAEEVHSKMLKGNYMKYPLQTIDE